MTFNPFAIFAALGIVGVSPYYNDEVEVDLADLIEPDMPDINDVLEPGYIVWVDTPAYGWQQGEVQFIDASPLYGEKFDRAYVTSFEDAPAWADYCAMGEFFLFDPRAR